jgi:DNA-binding MarR family transcriptional regulator
MDVRDTITVLMHDIARRVRYRFDARARTMGVTRPQWRALFTLARKPGLTQSELAEFLEVERISLCRMIDRLADAGLVERRADPNDRRVWRLHLTDNSHGIIDQLAEVAQEVEREALASLSPAEQELVHDALSRMRDALCARSCEDAA